jgi:glutamate-1-semialdehyde 2,1-aminomutase
MNTLNTPRSRALYERGLRVIPGGNTRSSVYFPPHPLYMASGQGARVTDADGVERIDFVNCMSAAIHGHCHPRIVEAVTRQARTLLCSGMPTEGEVRLAELICARLPGVEQVRLANSGTEALMFAVRVARSTTGRARIARPEGTYHGSYDPFYVSVRPTPAGWGPAAQPSAMPQSEGLAPSVLQETLVLPFNDVAATRALIERHAADLACIVIDPFPAYLGFLGATPEYLAVLRELATRHGIVLIYDEVICFRLGPNGAQGHFGVLPDLTALGKVIGGGLPVGALGGRRELMQVFDHRSGHARVEQSGTFSGNPMTCAAGIAALEALDAAAYAHLQALGDRLREGLRGALKTTGVTGQVAGAASMVALQFHAVRYRNYRELAAAMAAPGVIGRVHWLHRWLLDHGVASISAGAFFLSTPMTAVDIDYTIAAATDGLAEMARRPDAEFQGSPG